MIEGAVVRHYISVDSTNHEARRLLEQGLTGPLWLLADAQTQGRGRLGREWHSPIGNLYATLLLQLDVEESAVAQLGFVVSLAVHDVADGFAPSQVKLKWPNDCLIGGAKFSGILCEVIKQRPLVVAIGCGINVNHAPEGLAYPATCLAAQGVVADRDQVFGAYQGALAGRLRQWSYGAGFAATSSDWSRHAIGMGEVVTVSNGSTVQRGCFVGIGEDGALLLDVGNRLRIYAGDVSIPSLNRMRQD